WNVGVGRTAPLTVDYTMVILRIRDVGRLHGSVWRRPELGRKGPAGATCLLAFLRLGAVRAEGAKGTGAANALLEAGDLAGGECDTPVGQARNDGHVAVTPGAVHGVKVHGSTLWTSGEPDAA